MLRKPIHQIFISSLAALLLASCSYNPFTTHNHLTGNAAGPIVGGVAGGATAGILGASKTVIGLSAVAGAAVGYYFTTRDFASGGVKALGGNVNVQGQYVTIDLPSDYVFDSNSDELLPDAEPALRSAINVLSYFPDDNIIVSGNTSGFGTSKREQELSERRARVISEFLWKNGVNDFQGNGITSRKLSYVGYGSYFPIANDIRLTGIRQNSRIQITGYPTSASLKMSGREKFFANIGKDEETIVYPKREPNVDYAFSEDQMPENFPAVHRAYGSPFRGWKGDSLIWKGTTTVYKK